jgi:hypothetical protein
MSDRRTPEPSQQIVMVVRLTSTVRQILSPDLKRQYTDTLEHILMLTFAVPVTRLIRHATNSSSDDRVDVTCVHYQNSITVHDCRYSVRNADYCTR